MVALAATMFVLVIAITVPFALIGACFATIRATSHAIWQMIADAKEGLE
jgi:hypothetical protein